MRKSAFINKGAFFVRSRCNLFLDQGEAKNNSVSIIKSLLKRTKVTQLQYSLKSQRSFNPSNHGPDNHKTLSLPQSV